MKKHTLLFAAAFFLLLFLQPVQADGQPPMDHHRGPPGKPHPYGDYSPQRQRDYGATRAVENEQQARQILEAYFGHLDVSVGALEGKRWFYRAEILDASGKLIDIVIIDRRTGRIRSIF